MAQIDMIKSSWVKNHLLLHYDEDGICAPELNKNILKQWSYTGNKPVISSVLANNLFTDLGVDTVLEKLYPLGSHSLALQNISPGRKKTLYSIFKPYAARNDDFGTVYAHLQHFWYHYDIAQIKDVLRAVEEKDREMWSEVLVHDRIMRWNVAPQHLWDLYANRVVPYWVVNTFLWGTCLPSVWWGISHAWVDKTNCVNVMTPINGYEWPVLMPRDANLDLIRIEMLNLRVEYAWLDGGKGEHLRLEEWKLDVPTIGWVYEYSPHVEITDDAIIGGETGDDIMDMEVQKAFDERLACLQEMRKRRFVLELASEMQNRVSSMPLDKVTGLQYILFTSCIPIYDAEMSDMEAWEVLMDTMISWHWAELFFHFPEPRNGRKYWQPSWQQILTIKHFMYCSFEQPGFYLQGVTDGDWYEGYCINPADVWGLDEVLKEGQPCQGEMCFKNAAGLSCTVNILADHVYPIPDGSYALIGASNWFDWDSTCPLRYWVVGKVRDDGKFKKLYSEKTLLSANQNNILREAIEPNLNAGLRSDESIVEISCSKSRGSKSNPRESGMEIDAYWILVYRESWRKVDKGKEGIICHLRLIEDAIGEALKVRGIIFHLTNFEACEWNTGEKMSSSGCEDWAVWEQFYLPDTRRDIDYCNNHADGGGIDTVKVEAFVARDWVAWYITI
ncbi:hypothetical protein EDD18DRAFT_1103648 [Armillaria luteobubalina]|uniref:Heterokaryon incompatibility domain-containing protein n=1 Tax=Armillaria luteobubalina TaxID=153913 RepID=A0AA39UVH3_9AGAR|nr:hypothetical protein EDD18DRAFT_1103648 [Armillaria luteobubalina]